MYNTRHMGLRRGKFWALDAGGAKPKGTTNQGLFNMVTMWPALANCSGFEQTWNAGFGPEWKLGTATREFLCCEVTGSVSAAPVLCACLFSRIIRNDNKKSLQTLSISLGAVHASAEGSYYCHNTLAELCPFIVIDLEWCSDLAKWVGSGSLDISLQLLASGLP